MKVHRLAAYYIAEWKVVQ